MIFGITGYGHAATGAQDVLDHLPFGMLTPEELLECDMKSLSNKKVYRVVFREEDMVAPSTPGASISLQDYYRSLHRVHQHLPCLRT
jgi:hypothetical protein